MLDFLIRVVLLLLLAACPLRLLLVRPVRGPNARCRALQAVQPVQAVQAAPTTWRPPCLGLSASSPSIPLRAASLPIHCAPQALLPGPSSMLPRREGPARRACLQQLHMYCGRWPPPRRASPGDTPGGHAGHALRALRAALEPFQRVSHNAFQRRVAPSVVNPLCLYARLKRLKRSAGTPAIAPPRHATPTASHVDV